MNQLTRISVLSREFTREIEVKLEAFVTFFFILFSNTNFGFVINCNFHCLPRAKFVLTVITIYNISCNYNNFFLSLFTHCIGTHFTADIVFHSLHRVLSFVFSE